MPAPSRPSRLRLICAFLAVLGGALAAPAREHLSLDRDWKFHLGDDWPDALHLDKAGTGDGPAATAFVDTRWRTIQVPHDWAVELPFDPAADRNHGYKAIGPQYPKNSVAWYRRTFELPASDEGRRIWLTFDGVYRDATVWVNGWLVKRHESGYSPFREDITAVVNFGGTNTVAVRVDATKFEGWFYEGAGIYRHVWLDKTGPLAITPDGIFVRAEFPGDVPQGPATIRLSTTLRNQHRTAVEAAIRWSIVGPDGRTVAAAVTRTATKIPAGDESECLGMATVEAPVLWSPEHPALYRLITTVTTGETVVDREETSFGIRTVGFDPEIGFLLNGRRYEIHGTCNHQDHAGVGVALPDALQVFRLKKLKEFGCNAYRAAHNPPTPALLDACDRLGLLVLEESRLLGADSANLARWEQLIRRDRNHPSVAFWCVANEEFRVQDTPQAARAALAMQDLARRLDPTRPVTYAAPEDDVFRGINSVIEVRGWNYHLGPHVDAYHAGHPRQPNLGTEQASIVGTRGIYANNYERGEVNALDLVWPGWSDTAESWWTFFARRPWLSGAFVWTGFDYRGEPSPCNWPSISSHFGILDTCGFPKDSFYYYKSWWTNSPVLHLAPHWNWPGKEGQEILVQALSNCTSVELFLNGVSQGRQPMKRPSKLFWHVPYAPGTLSAKGYDNTGRVTAETKVETTGDAARLVLTPDRTTINADGEDVAVFTVSAVDAQGRIVPLAQHKVTFALEGAGRIIGVGNGNPNCHEADVLVPCVSTRSRSIDAWRWQFASGPRDRTSAPEYAADFDDSAWPVVPPGNAPNLVSPDTAAVYRAHLSLTAQDLAGAKALLHFRGCDDDGWFFVNGRLVGESHDWTAHPSFDVTPLLHPGDNVIAVGVHNGYATGGLDSQVTLELDDPTSSSAWTRSLFNGLAQVIVQSTRDAGEIHLTATAGGLAAATTVVRTQPCTPRTFLP